MADPFQAQSEEQVARFIAEAAVKREPLEVCGFGTKRAAGRPLSTASAISTARLSGITFYEPKQLVISAKAGTPLHEIEAVLSENGQELAFEPVHWTRIFTGEYHAATIGGVVAMNNAGPRRILRGAARDYLLGLRFVNGLGEIIKTGGRVMKNVTGVDLVRGLSGSWGTLGVITEVTLKVLPKARESRTLAFTGLDDDAAVGHMSAAHGTPFEVSGSIHLHGGLLDRLKDRALAPTGANFTALRLEGEGQSLDERVGRLRRKLAPLGESFVLPPERSAAFWQDIHARSFLSADFDAPLWRIAVAPSKAPLMVRALSRFFRVKAIYEWSGGLLWLELPPSLDASVTEVRRVLADHNADSMLVRGAKEIRGGIEVFHPLPLAKMRLVQAIKKAFDPLGILNPGRMYAGV